MKSKSKVISIEAIAMMRLQFAAAENGYRSGREFIEAILNLVGNDEGVLKGLVGKILECQEKDLERKENQNGTSGKSIPIDRKMNGADRKMNQQENDLKYAENEYRNETYGTPVGIDALKKESSMLKSYKTKAVLPDSVNGASGQDACLLPVLESDVYGGIPVVSDGEWKIRDGALFLTKNGKKGVIELLGADIDSEFVHKKIIALHCGERIEIDLSAKAGKI